VTGSVWNLHVATSHAKMADGNIGEVELRNTNTNSKDNHVLHNGFKENNDVVMKREVILFTFVFKDVY